MKFDLTKKVKFDYEGWDECYIEFTLPSFQDIKNISQDVPDDKKLESGLEVITGLFRGGCALSEGKKVDLKAEDIKDLPIEMVVKCFQAVTGEIDPKA